jgi:hypothetical protein
MIKKLSRAKPRGKATTIFEISDSIETAKIDVGNLCGLMARLAEQNDQVSNTFVYAFITYLDGVEARLAEAMDQLHSLSEPTAGQDANAA